MSSTLRLILGDQLSETLEIITKANKKTDTLMLCEVAEEAGYVPHHPQKIALIFGAMRHFAAALVRQGYKVRYIKLVDLDNTGSFTRELQRAAAELKPDKIYVTEPGEYRVEKLFVALKKKLDCPLELLPDTRFLCARSEFAAWAKGRKQLRMEFFYREMRKRYRILLDDAGEPLGGRWNFDSENRAAAPEKLNLKPRPIAKPDTIRTEVVALVKQRFGKNFGTLDGFNYALTREDAQAELEYFITHVLPKFGTYQDAMLQDEAFLYHSVLSAYLNIGLLLPLEVCQRAEAAYHKGHAPLNSVEGFIRQILGWREYVRGIYWTQMPAYGELNYFNTTRKLPALYWGAPTGMNCLKGAVEHTRKHAYSHHIQRLMVTGNFALLAGLDVKAVQEWYLAVYADAFEWVEMPNTLGMALFGDGGIMASKPYAASGKYIDKMSNYCAGCRYNPALTTEANACPFNALYWDFIARHEDKLKTNQRMTYSYATLRRMAPQKVAALRAKAAELLAQLERDEL